MDHHQETPQEKREKLRQKELNNPYVALKDEFDRAEIGNLADLVSGLGWKGTGIVLAIIVGYVLYNSIF